MLLGGSIAVAFQQAGDHFGFEIFDAVGFALVLLSAFAVSGAVIYGVVATMRNESNSSTASTD